jgi:WD40 repeat protein
VVRIDLATNEVLAEIPVRDTPWRKRIAVTDEGVWVASTGTLERIDPATNTVVATVDLQGRPVSAIAADPTAVWTVAITELAEGAGEWTGTLVRVDPATNEVVAEIPLGPQVAGYEDEVMLGADSVWVLGVRWFEKEDAEYGSDLIRVDPATNAIAARIPVGGFHMVMGADEVWVRFPADGVFDTYGERWLWARVDVRTNEPSDPFEFNDEGLRLVTPDTLWSVGYDEQEHVRVSRFDPETLELEARSEPIRSYFHDAVIDSASGTVWVSAVWNLVRVDIGEEAPATSPGSIGSTTASLPEGTLLVNVGRNVELLDEGTETSTRIGQDLFALDLSGDGRRALVSTPWDSVGPETPLWSLDLASGERTVIADLRSWGMPVRWSPDASSVAVRVGEQNLLCIRSLAAGEARCLPELGRVYEFDWSPDSTRLVFDQGLPGSLTILDVATGQTSVLVRWDDPAVLDEVADAGLGEPAGIQFQGPRWSPSGRYIAALAMVRADEGHTGNIVMVFDLDGNVVARGTPFDEFSDARAWSPVADMFAYASGEPPYRIVELRVLDVATGEDRALASTDDVGRETIRSLGWSPSGHWLAIGTIVGSGGYFSSKIHVLDVTGNEPPRIFRSEAIPEIVGWGP